MKIEVDGLVGLMSKAYGLDISIFDESFLVKSIEKRMAVSGLTSFKEFIHVIKESKTEAITFFDSLNITFSEFFRNPVTYAYLEDIILPQLIEKKRFQKEVRIWSAACAAGQEPYSLAILFNEVAERTNATTTCRICATDINQAELVRAVQGVYQLASIKKVALNRVLNNFTHKGENYTVSSKLKKCVDFSIFNLLTEKQLCPESSIFGNFDLVFCSNLLFYYKPVYRRRIIEKIGNSLSSGGYVITGETEREIIMKYNFKEVFVNSAIFQKRK